MKAPGIPFREITGSLWCRCMTWLWVKLEWWGWRCRCCKPLSTGLYLASWYIDEARFWGE